MYFAIAGNRNAFHLTDDPERSVQDLLPLIVGSASAGFVVILAMVVIAVVCLR